jgi:N-acetylneuraminate synthase
MNLENLFIFEIANNHSGKVDHGKKIIDFVSKIALKYKIKAAVKFQFRNLDSFIHPNYQNSFEFSYIKRFTSTRLSYSDFIELIDYSKKKGLIPFATAFDEDSLEWIRKLDFDIIKIASSSSSDWPLIEKALTLNKKLIISTGGLYQYEIDALYTYLKHESADFSLMHCTSIYPTNLDDSQIGYIEVMKRRYPDVEIGYSGHERPEDTIVSQLAISKGATFLERHVGLETEEISKNDYSMNEEETEKFVKSILDVKTILLTGSKNERSTSLIERESVRSLGRGVYLKSDVNIGESIQSRDVYFAMPLLTNQTHVSEFINGIVATKNYKKNDPLYDKLSKESRYPKIRNFVHQARGILNYSGIPVNHFESIELSHHYGTNAFQDYGSTIINIVNREYCKKIIIVLPGQKHPLHFHKLKEETFHLLYGDLLLNLSNHNVSMKLGEVQLIKRNEIHGFSSEYGAIFEEISTTHYKNDSYYIDDEIDNIDPSLRKTIIEDW